MSRRNVRETAGFTIIELLVVLGLITFLGAMTLMALTLSRFRCRARLAMLIWLHIFAYIYLPTHMGQLPHINSGIYCINIQ